jgi:hypothetical protein
LIAIKQDPSALSSQESTGPLSLIANRIVCILPLVHVRDLLFRGELGPIPFLDAEGIFVSSAEAQKLILGKGTELALESKARAVELRSPRSF